jgi:SAM-dependent methyltransferase
MRNTFSATWFSAILDQIPHDHTEREVAFVARHLPLPKHERLLDLCCGSGRHAIPLGALGYDVLGVDTDSAAFERARAATPSAARVRYMQADMRDLASLAETFDGAINMWHSFGYDDDAANLALLVSVRERLRRGGRCIFDIYNREYFATLPLTEISDRGGHRMHTTRAWAGNRLTVTLRWDDGSSGDAFEWRLYSPSEFTELASNAGLRVVCSCAWFDEAMPPSVEHGRMQFVFERG